MVYVVKKKRKSLHGPCITWSQTQQDIVSLFNMKAEHGEPPRIGTSRRMRLFTGRYRDPEKKKMEFAPQPPTIQALAQHCQWGKESTDFFREAETHGCSAPEKTLQVCKKGELGDFYRSIVQILRDRFRNKFYLYCIPQIEYRKDQKTGRIIRGKQGEMALCLIPISLSIAQDYLKDTNPKEAERILLECAYAAVWITHVLMVSLKLVASHHEAIELLGDWSTILSDEEIRFIACQGDASRHLLV